MTNFYLNKLIHFVLLIGIGCQDGNQGDKDVVIAGVMPITNEPLAYPAEKATETGIDIEKSIIRWKGTKMMRNGKHEGTLNFKEGVLFFDDDKLVGGRVVADMKSILVTDMPSHETVPIRNLTTHLNSDFETQKYLTSSFEIIQVEYLNDSLLTLSGNMTIKDVSKNISITLLISTIQENQKQLEAQFTIDRFEWNIGIDGSWLEKKLVDKEIELIIRIITN